MAEVQRRNTDAVEMGERRGERRKSGIFFFSKSFKKSSTYHKAGAADSEATESTPTTPTMSPLKDAELKRTDSARSIPMLATTTAVTAEAERPSSNTPPTAASLALQKSASRGNLDGPTPSPPSSQQLDQDKTDEQPGVPAEELPTPPDTPGADTSATAAKRVSYHEDADVHIKVREADGVEAVYSVRSAALETASPAWKHELSTPTRPSSSSELPAYGLDVVFSIAHYKFRSIPPPQPLTIRELYDIAVVADRYQTQHLLVPFVRAWTAHITLTAADDDADDNNDSTKALVLAWILGEARLFAQAAARCAHRSRIDAATGALVAPDGRPWTQHIDSAAIVVEHLAAQRASAVARIVEAASAPVRGLLNPQQEQRQDCPCPCLAPADDAAREDCEQLQLGSAIMGLSKARLWPPPDAARVAVSPVELAAAYAGVRMRRYQAPGLRFGGDEAAAVDAHARCGFGHLDAIKAILDAPAVLGADLVRELYARARRSGVYGEDVFAGLTGDLADGVVEAVDAQQKRSAVGFKQVSVKPPVSDEAASGEAAKGDE